MQTDAARCSALLSNKTDGIIIPDIVPAPAVATSLAEIGGLQLGRYDTERVWPPIANFGPALNDFRDRQGRLRPNYWESTRDAIARSHTLSSLNAVRTAALRRLTDTLGRTIRVATIHGHQVYHGAVREMSGGTLVHFDDIAKEFSLQLLDQHITQQFAFVVYLAMPTRGGETTIWERGPLPADQRLRIGYGYDESVTTGLGSMTFKPTPGQGLLFRCSRLHAVSECASGRRVSLHFFVGLTEGDEVVVWA